MMHVLLTFGLHFLEYNLLPNPQDGVDTSCDHITIIHFDSLVGCDRMAINSEVGRQSLIIHQAPQNVVRGGPVFRTLVVIKDVSMNLAKAAMREQDQESIHNGVRILADPHSVSIHQLQRQSQLPVQRTAEMISAKP
jgi:hypothetical protein